MSINRKYSSAAFATFTAVAALLLVNIAYAGVQRDEGRLLTATEVLADVQAMPDQRIPDALLSRAYGIAVIPDVMKVAFIFGGRHGNGVVVVRDKLNTPWSNPVFLSINGGSWGLQIGAEVTDIILVFTTRAGIEGLAGGKFTLGANASVAAGPVGRQGSAATDIAFSAEIYSYARTRGLFGGIAVDGSVISINRSANADFYGKSGVQASEIFSEQAPAPPAPAQHFLERLAQVTHTAVRTSPAPQADTPAAARIPAAPGTPATPAAPPTAEAPRTYPLEDQKP